MKLCLVVNVGYNDLKRKFCPGINPHADTPVEILHTVLLGFVKYFWRDVVQNQIGKKAEKKHLLEVRLSSVNTSGLGIGKISGSTLVQYAGSLTGQDFRIIIQVASFVLHDLVSPSCYRAWVSLSNLVPIVWQPQIPDIDKYLVWAMPSVYFPFLKVAPRHSYAWGSRTSLHALPNGLHNGSTNQSSITSCISRITSDVLDLQLFSRQKFLNHTML